MMSESNAFLGNSFEKITRIGAISLVVFNFSLVGMTLADAATTTRQVQSAGSVVLGAVASGTVDGLQTPEFQPGLAALQIADAPKTGGAIAAATSAPAVVTAVRGGRVANRSFARNQGVGAEVDSPSVVAASASRGTLQLSFDGLNHRQTRLANGGNQFSNEPPDQGLCAGNGYVLETVNDVMNVFDTSGKSLTGPVALNAFYGYEPAIDRARRVYGPFITDPSCYYDHDTRRWFHISLTFDVDSTSGGFLGSNHLDLAVSASSDPTGSWKVYRIAAQDDGTQGTPIHPNCPCLGDYPHLGADANGIFITTNEFPFSGGYNSSQIYALSKHALARGDTGVQVVQIDTADYLFEFNPGFTVWPAQSPAGEYEHDRQGTEYFVSSLAVFNDSGTDNRLRIWALTNTSSLDSPSPNLALANGIVGVSSYGVPPSSFQKSGDTPLRDCINDTAIATPYGPGCWQLFFGAEPAHTEVEARTDANDSRIQQVVFANGRLFTALDTVLKVNGKDQSGAAYFIIDPAVHGNRAGGEVTRQGIVGVPHNNVNYPAIAALPNGRAVMSFTLTGADHYPTAAYVRISESGGAGAVQVAAEGVGPQDGFSGYAAYGASLDSMSGNAPYSRWGDYGAAVADGDTIWIASEYIGQTCTLAQYLSTPIGSCGGTRTSLANWDTRISRISP
jgi:hypothetical protein